ncbi:MAG: HAMP domain-containing histidine kinase [Sphingobium sp.]|nr:HAMP domain-containing histidine kinase [Sphingobium sp.]
MTSAGATPVTASLDRDGCILRADDRLTVLQIEAGGQPNGPFALPSLAGVVRLALRLGMPLSRPVDLARDEADISVWAQLRPENDGVHLTLIDWQERRPRQPMSHAAALEAMADDSASRGWDWQVDDQMRFSHLDLSATRIGHAVPEDGDTFTAFFALADSGGAEGGQRAMPMIEALVRHMNFEGQHAYLRSDPDLRYILSGTALFDHTGTFSGYRGHAVREDKAAIFPPEAAPEDLVAAQAASPAPERAQSEFIGPALSRRLDTALRQPISRIIANAGTIGERIGGPLRQDYANYASDIAAAGRHLLALVDDLADLQAVEGPGFLTTSEEVDLSEIARRAGGLLNIRAEARRITIQAPAADEQVLARAEYRRVLQILVNLVGNAVRHSPEESTIWIRLDEVDGRARVVVADQGNGVDPADHERIFERFERLGNTDGSGSGLGLYISRKLARIMGGDVTVESALGRGARFVLDLPAWNKSRSGSQVG